MSAVLQVHSQQLRKDGEELCGDTVRVAGSAQRDIVVLSDGLGSGVKANILSTMTAQILVTMLSRDVPLTDVVDTMVGTLPACRVRQLAYATFTVATFERRSRLLRTVNFDNPTPVVVSDGRWFHPREETHRIGKRDVRLAEVRLSEGDLVGIVSDGTTFAGIGHTLNFGWGLENVARCMCDAHARAGDDVRAVVDAVMTRTRALYDDHPGDDATCVAMLVREARTVLLFTGPPIDRGADRAVARRLAEFEGRRIVCGGTSGNLVARELGRELAVDVSTMTADVPPVASLAGFHLVTEGIITMNRALRLLEQHADASTLPAAPTGDVRLARELLLADSVHVLVGNAINEYYQNPEFARVVSLRKSLVQELAVALRARGRSVTVEHV